MTTRRNPAPPGSRPQPARWARVVALALVLAASSAARADGELLRHMTPDDRERLERHEPVRDSALAAARSGGDAASLAELERAMAGLPQPLASVDLTGPWRCRVLRLGNEPPLVVYGWFACRIDDDGAGWRLRKLTGSERTEGRFFDLGGNRMAYLGVGTTGAQPAVARGRDPARDQFAIATVPGADRLRLEFPLPPRGRGLDVLELQRGTPGLPAGASPVASAVASPAAVSVPRGSTVEVDGQARRAAGVLRSAVAGDTACHLTLVDDAGATFTEAADFSLCERGRALRGQRLALTYRTLDVLAVECQGVPDCRRHTRMAVVVAAQPAPLK